MNLPNKDDLKVLTGRHEGLCVSIYMPTFRAGRETRQNPILFKNLMAKSEKLLEEGGLRRNEIQNMLHPAQRLLHDSLYWQHQEDGLAVFISPEVFIDYRVPFRFPKLAMVNSRFHVKPLLSLFTGDGRFYILALSLHRARLFQGTRFNVGELDLENVPTSLSEALGYDNLQKHIQFHTGTGAGGMGGRRDAMFHGHGGGLDDAKDDILRYFQRVDEGLQEFFHDEASPLVLAGVDYLLPLYREANSYPHLMEKSIPGNPDELSAQSLHQKTWEIVRPVFQQNRKEAEARFEELEGTGKATDSLDTLVPAAYQGRVAVLFVAVGVQRWGLFDPEADKLSLSEEFEMGKEDVLDYAAVQTLLNGGTVYAVDPENIPGSSTAAAIFRY